MHCVDTCIFGYRPTVESQWHSCTLCNVQYPYYSKLRRHLQREKYRQFEASLSMCDELEYTPNSVSIIIMHARCPPSYMHDCMCCSHVLQHKTIVQENTLSSPRVQSMSVDNKNQNCGHIVQLYMYIQHA